ncbi:membrane hypothetical protein [Candidatus Sulfopaludibacter sp. SbA3]|nr:membrane hypothetical protein [Candidatus Sulfopaludibacter sp. SbA3]
MANLVASGKYLAEKAEFLRLRGPLVEDPTARILHALLIGLLLFTAVHLLVFTFLVYRPLPHVAVSGFGGIAYLTALVVLNRGARRMASLIYLGGIWVFATTVVVLNGGIRSPGLALYIAIPVSAGLAAGKSRYGRDWRTLPVRCPGDGHSRFVGRTASALFSGLSIRHLGRLSDGCGGCGRSGDAGAADSERFARGDGAVDPGASR